MPLQRLLQQGSKYTTSLDVINGLGHSLADSSLSASVSASLIGTNKRMMEYGVRSLDLITGFRNSVANSSLPSQSSALLQDYAKRVMDLFNQPRVRKMIAAYVATFAVSFIFLAFLGFGPIGVGGGTLAAAFQSVFYGGFVPAGGLFATLTSMGMLGTLLPAAAGISAVAATLTTAVVWARSRTI